MVELGGRERERWEEMGQIIMTNCDLRGFRVRVILPAPIQQVRVPIWSVITPIWGLPNPIRQGVPVISHIRSCPLHHSQLHPPSLSFSSTTQPSSQNTQLTNPFQSLHAMVMCWHRVQHTPSTAYTEYSIHRVQHTPSTAYTEYSIHRVQHTPSTAYTKDCLSSLHTHDYELTAECSSSFRRASLHDRLLTVVLATGPGNPPVVWFLASGLVWFGSSAGQTPDPLCLGGVVTRTGHKPVICWPGWNPPMILYYGSYNFANSLAPIKFSGSDRIMTWSVRRLCSFGSSSTSRIQNCDATNNRWVTVK